MTFLRRLFRDRAEEERLHGELRMAADLAIRQETLIETLRELLAERRPAPARGILTRIPPQPGTVGISPAAPVPVRPRKATVDRDPGPLPGYDGDQIERDDDVPLKVWNGD